jgi:hypothetical protein
MEETAEYKIIRRLCEFLYPNRRNRIIFRIQDIVEFVGVTKERLLALILKYYSINGLKNLYFTEYNPEDKDDAIEISLTTLGAYLCEMTDDDLWKQVLENLPLSPLYESKKTLTT